MLKDYLLAVGLPEYIDSVSKVTTTGVVNSAFSDKKKAFSPLEIQSLYERFSAKGESEHLGSGDVYEMDETPYHLADTYGISRDSNTLAKHPMTLRLWRLNRVIENTLRLMPLHWLGIYRRIEIGDAPILLREASVPYLSRAEFPITEHFAKLSNISAVGSTGKATHIPNLQTHSGRYYFYSNKTGSELCLPLLLQDKVVGVIDAESFQPNFFTPERVVQLAQIALNLVAIDSLLQEKDRLTP